MEQQEVYLAVVERGYHEACSDQAFAARQVAKLLEELGELAELFRMPAIMALRLADAAKEAREKFDRVGDWAFCRPIGPVPQIQQELADLQVVLFCLAQEVARISGQPFDVVQAAVEKATADVERGVREAE